MEKVAAICSQKRTDFHDDCFVDNLFPVWDAFYFNYLERVLGQPITPSAHHYYTLEIKHRWCCLPQHSSCSSQWRPVAECHVTAAAATVVQFCRQCQRLRPNYDTLR